MGMNHQTWAVVLRGCAWFLWSEISEKRPGKSFDDTWQTGWDALETKSECEERMQERIAVWAKGGMQTKGHSVFQIKSPEQDYMLITYYCLPDTVDPRQPKR
jgi:hypothetical protein